tara:strand:- start:9844 stop:10509 length:666 start_codon:yes stop_codon:yes gene_type:complete
MKVFVINLNADRWEKYDSNKWSVSPYTRFQAIDGNKELDPQWVDDNYHFYWNANRKLRQSVAGCSESHLKLLQHIIDNKIDNVIILEDDCILDFSKLELLKDVDDICYVGGMFHPPILKNLKTFKRPENLIEGINVINPEKFLITNAQAYYIPHWKQAQELLIQQHKKRRAIDVEYKSLQKKGIIKYFLYPAIGTLHLPDAEKGFTWSQSNYKLTNDLKYF